MHSPGPFAAVTLFCGRRERTFFLGSWLLGMVALVLPLVAVCTLGATAYLVWHDELLASLMTRQSEMQYAYEDRIAALNTALDQVSTRGNADRLLLETNLRELALKSEQLESRAATIDDMVARLAPGGIVASAPSGATERPPRERSSQEGTLPLRAPSAWRITPMPATCCPPAALPAFRDCYAAQGVPPERVVVIDEAQRCWSAAHAIAKTASRPAKLRDGEPGLMLDIMARRDDGPVILCLIGTGQEIHDGEGGLAGWGEALLLRPAWRVLAADAALSAALPRHRLPLLPQVTRRASFHLQVPVRSLRCGAAPSWVDAVLAGDSQAARGLALGGMPFSVTRDLAVLRARLRAACRGTRRAGLVCSSGARRLRAEGLGAVLPHDDAGAVARWFLEQPPDIRASGALEVAATEFFVQGLELDAAGLCWDGDLVRKGAAWQARALRGTGWTLPRSPEKLQNKLNAYRVLLTRARYETVIWVPRGDPADPTREPDRLDAVAAFLLECGAALADGEAGPAACPVTVRRTPELFAVA